MDIGSSIRKIREKHGIHQSEIAKVLGISQSYYSKLEQKETSITVKLLFDICEYYNIEFKDLVGEPKINISLNKLIISLKKSKLSNKQLDTLTLFIESLNS